VREHRPSKEDEAMSNALLRHAMQGNQISPEEAVQLAGCDDLHALMNVAGALRDQGHGSNISYSCKVFIPLTQLCRDSCHYCTFAHLPRKNQRAYLTADEILAIARAGAKAGCREALFTLGDRPELRYRVAREELARLGYDSTLGYLAEMADLVWRETGLFPHLNPGVMAPDQIVRLRSVSVSQGLMLESASERLCLRGGPHFGSPDKRPAVRIETIRGAGKASVPFTSGILIGIGETRLERIESLLQIRSLHECYGHLQEIIIQNFRAKPGTKMSRHPEPDAAEHLWTIAVARILFGAAMNIQAPPNLSAAPLPQLIAAGINDWGGVSPVTPDHVNPERPWPQLDTLAAETAAAGKILVERLAVYPSYALAAAQWIEPPLRTAVLRASDSKGLARTESWTPGSGTTPPSAPAIGPRDRLLSSIIDRAYAGKELAEQQLIALFDARGESFREVCAAADALRREISGDDVSYVVTRNINYTNICSYHCSFCAFSKGKGGDTLRGRPYDLAIEEIQRRCVEAWDRGAVEVCLQGGIHPDYTGATYLAICHAIKAATPRMHIHAFSPLEISQGAATLGISVAGLLSELVSAGLGSLPGTAAEVLDDEVRRIICPDKISTDEWLSVVETAHRIGLRTTSTIMYGHVDQPRHWARHLLHLLHLQQRTGGLTEFVPLPFVPMEAPMNLRGQCRNGPTFREAVLMHSVARLAFHRLIPNIQTSWVKMGPEGVSTCLESGANDLGGTLMNERITRAAGSVHGQEMTPEAMETAIEMLGRKPWQRTTLYQSAPADRISASFGAPPIAPAIDTPPRKTLRLV
jgi:FO synthase